MERDIGLNLVMTEIVRIKEFPEFSQIQLRLFLPAATPLTRII